MIPLAPRRSAPAAFLLLALLLLPAPGLHAQADEALTEQFLPGGPDGWTLGWHDEFKGEGIDGTGEPAGWYAHLGTGWWNYETSDEAGLRWSGDKPDSAWMFSTKFANKLSDGKGTYWLDGSPEGHLMLRAVVDKRDRLDNAASPNRGGKVECAYLQTGHPVKADGVNEYPRPAGMDPWAGEFVGPGDTGVFLSCRAMTGDIDGWSTWFAFWAHSHTQAYDNRTGPAFSSRDGTEIDVVEIWGSQEAYTLHAFSNNNHWRDDGRGSAGIRFDFGPPNDPDPPRGLRVQDDRYHEYGVHWTRDELVFYVDGIETWRTREHVPSHPRDMMILLTLEFQVDKWEGHQGDGRTGGRPLYEDRDLRVMSQVAVDWVRVHAAKPR